MAARQVIHTPQTLVPPRGDSGPAGAGPAASPWPGRPWHRAGYAERCRPVTAADASERNTEAMGDRARQPAVAHPAMPGAQPQPGRRCSDRPARLRVGVIGTGRAGGAGCGAGPGWPSGGRGLRRLGRSRGRPGGCCPACRSAPAGRAGRGRPGAAHRPGRRAARPGRPGWPRPGAPLAAAGRARQRPARHRVLDPATRAGRAAAGAAPGDDVHRQAGRPRPAGRGLLRGHRAGAAPAGGRGPGDRDGRRAGVHRGGGPRALPRRPGQRGQPPGRPGGPVRRPAPRGRGGRAGPDARAAAVRRAGQRAAARRRRR